MLLFRDFKIGGNGMGEYNQLYLEHRDLKDRLKKEIFIYRKGMEQGYTVLASFVKPECHEQLECYQKLCTEAMDLFERELDAMIVTTVGGLRYKGGIYKDPSALDCIVRQHLGILEGYQNSLLQREECLKDAYQSYANLLKKFTVMRERQEASALG